MCGIMWRNVTKLHLLLYEKEQKTRGGEHMKKKAKTIILVVLLVIAVVYFFPQKVNIGEASKIKLRDGSNGNEVVITEPEDIAYITDNINKLSFIRTTLTAGTGGWSYWLTWYDADGNEVESLVLCADRSISGDTFFYWSINGEFDSEFLDMKLVGGKNAE